MAQVSKSPRPEPARVPAAQAERSSSGRAVIDYSPHGERMRELAQLARNHAAAAAQRQRPGSLYGAAVRPRDKIEKEPRRQTVESSARTPAQATVQLARGDGVVVIRDTPLLKTRSRTAKVITQLDAGTACTEVDPGNDKLIKVKIFREGAGAQLGWVSLADISRQPGIAGEKEDRIASTPDRFTKLNRAPFVGDPTSRDIQQGGLGDCWLLAPLAAIIDTAQGKLAIQSMITPHGAAESWTVRFYQRIAADSNETREVHIVVDNWFATDSDGGLLYADASEKQGIWPQIIEKAVAQLNDGYEKASGGSSEDAFLLIANKVPDSYAARHDPNALFPATISPEENLKKLLRGAVRNGKPVTVDIPPSRNKEEYNTVMSVNQTGFAVFVPHTGLLEISVVVDYMSSSGAKINRRYSGGNIDVIPFSEDRKTMIDFTLSGDPAPNGKATVSYAYTDVKSRGKEITGKHAYKFISLNHKGDKAYLADPHHTDLVTTMDFKALYKNLDARFIIGSV